MKTTSLNLSSFIYQDKKEQNDGDDDDDDDDNDDDDNDNDLSMCNGPNYIDKGIEMDAKCINCFGALVNVEIVSSL